MFTLGVAALVIATIVPSVIGGSQTPMAKAASNSMIAQDPSGSGYWLAAADGGVFAFGGAQFYGSMAGKHLNTPIVGIESTPDGGGYWLVASDGGTFAFGDAQFLGSMAGTHLNGQVVGIASPSGSGTQGPQGPQGPPGPPGPQGPSTAFFITDARTYAPGATVTYVGKGWNGCTSVKIDLYGPGGFTVATGIMPVDGFFTGTFTAPSIVSSQSLLFAEGTPDPPCQALTVFSVTAT
jgi:hypothetical protein